MDLQVHSLKRTKPGGKFTKASKSRLKKSLDIAKQQRMLKTFNRNNALRNEAAIDWPLSNRSSKVAPITIDFKIIVMMSRVLGSHPHPLWSSERMASTSKIAKLYSMLWAIISGILIASQIYELLLCPMKTNDDSLCIPRVMFNIAISVSHLLSILTSVIGARNFETAVARIQDFDEATCSEMKCNLLTNVMAAGLLILSWCVVFWISPIPQTIQEPSMIVRTLGSCAFSLEIYRFCFVLIAVLKRFVRLQTLISSGGIDVGATKGIYYQPLTVQNVLTLHHWLSDAVANFNKYFNIQIVYWLVYIIFDLVKSAFRTAFTALKMSLTADHLIYPIYLLCNATLMCATSHFTCKRANELGKLLFGYRAPKLETTVSSMEGLEFGFYLYMKPLRITGLGMFYVDLPLLLTLLEASATYMILIIQNGAAVYDAVAVNAIYWNMSTDMRIQT